MVGSEQTTVGSVKVKVAWVVCPGSSATRGVEADGARAAGTPSCTPLAMTADTPGKPCNVHIVGLVFVKTNCRISVPAAPWLPPVVTVS